MSTTESSPALAACAATELARLPVDAQATRVKPSWRAAVSATETTRSLNEWVGLALSSLTQSSRMPSSSASRSARTSGVIPGFSVTRPAGSWPTGSSPAYRQIDCGPASMPERVSAASASWSYPISSGPKHSSTRAGVRGGSELHSCGTGASRRQRRSARRQSGSLEKVPLIFPGQTPGTDLAPAASSRGGCRGFIGPCPSAPLDEACVQLYWPFKHGGHAVGPSGRGGGCRRTFGAGSTGGPRGPRTGRRPGSWTSRVTPRVSVVLPALNEQETVGAIVAAIRRQPDGAARAGRRAGGDGLRLHRRDVRRGRRGGGQGGPPRGGAAASSSRCPARARCSGGRWPRRPATSSCSSTRDLRDFTPTSSPGCSARC